jgi:hypothetical protein
LKIGSRYLEVKRGYMNKLELYATRALVAMVAVALCGVPDAAQAQSAQQGVAQNQQAQPEELNPAQPPLQPIPPAAEPTPAQPFPSEPSGSGATKSQQPAAPSSDSVQQPQEPAGTAAAEGTPTAGGLASKPAGNAIAPAKQKQTRSLVIKLGLIAAAGVAIGTVALLTKGSPTQPPGTSSKTSAEARMW